MRINQLKTLPSGLFFIAYEGLGYLLILLIGKDVISVQHHLETMKMWNYKMFHSIRKYWMEFIFLSVNAYKILGQYKGQIMVS